MGIKVLDCTLRDGAYVVNSLFGKETIKDIITSLHSAGIDIIECGWLKDCSYNKDSVFYNTPEDLKNLSSDFALMFDYGKYDINKLNNTCSSIIIRIAFHKNNLDEVSFAVEQIKTKGYKVFLQPSYITEYSEKEIENLCKRADFINADAVYIVDSSGSMYPEDLARIIPVFNENVSKNIEIGFHSHNNIQLSFGLAIQFINTLKTRNIIVDSSLCGLGRGAGNIKTELLAEYLNKSEKRYDTTIIQKCIDKNILPLYKKYNWEYTPQLGLKGIKGLHPNEEL